MALGILRSCAHKSRAPLCGAYRSAPSTTRPIIPASSAALGRRPISFRWRRRFRYLRFSAVLRQRSEQYRAWYAPLTYGLAHIRTPGCVCRRQDRDTPSSHMKRAATSLAKRRSNRPLGGRKSSGRTPWSNRPAKSDHESVARSAAPPIASSASSPGSSPVSAVVRTGPLHPGTDRAVRRTRPTSARCQAMDSDGSSAREVPPSGRMAPMRRQWAGRVGAVRRGTH